ncbi:glycosyltransferase [Ruegeria sp. HKCCA4707]|uniref:glycosyltransferase n=1 Tax=Ruegeria sp. HKCCA4707 TaxID=2682984 RepID=UPI00148862CA|nr:glycosyltransferase [Ruegeria sp. HKCCA4707]
MTKEFPNDRNGALRISIVSRNLLVGAGGMERTAANLANHMALQGHVVAVSYRDQPGRSSLYPLAEAVEHIPFDGTTGSLTDGIESFRPEVVVYFYATSMEAPSIFAICQTGVPVVLHEGSNPERVINNNWAVEKGISPEQAKLERLAMMSVCTRIRFTLPQYRDSLPLPLRKDSVAFPNAFAPAEPENLTLRSDTGRRIFLNIGGLKRVKNVMAAVRAFAMIADDLHDWDFHIFSAEGARNPVRPELERFVAREGLVGRVKVFPPTPYIGREYGRSHVHVIASKEEGLPNCIAEAACHGLPSIGFTCCPGTNSMIVHEHNGLLAEGGVNEIHHLAAAMRRAATDDTARKRWGDIALKESVLYAPERVFSEWEKLILGAAADRASPEERLRRRFDKDGEWRRLRAVQRSSFAAEPWSLPPRPSFDEAEPRVSIVVALFNKEEYIGETLDTISACAYPFKEVLVVDDCSTDRSANIAAEYCARHNWKLIRHAQNGGVSAARNTGLAAARGEYIHFWDADDIYHPDGIGTLLHAMHKSAADIGTGVATRDGEVIGRYVASARDVAGFNYAQVPESLSTTSACFKVYRRSFLLENGLQFIPGLHIEDAAFNLCAFPLAERIAMTSAILGEYRFVEKSESRKIHPARYDSALRTEEITHDFYFENGLHALDALRQDQLISKVLAFFVRRARHGSLPIDEQTRPEDLDFNFLAELQRRLPRLSEGLLMNSDRNIRTRLACCAIRAGYLIWVPFLLGGVRPDGLRSDLLAAAESEKPIIDAMLKKLRHAGKVATK